MAIELKNIKSVGRNDKNSTKTPEKKSKFGIHINPFSLRHKELFFKELAILLNSGLDLKQGITLLGEGEENVKRRDILDTLKNSIEKGMSFSEALAVSNSFTQYETQSIAIGEETGKLASVLEKLSAHFSNRIKQRKTVTGALVYPAVIFITAVGAVTFLMMFMVPIFKDVFMRSGQTLPGITQLVISVSEFLGKYTIWIILWIIVSGIIIYTNKDNLRMRHLKSLLMRNTPVFKNFYKNNICMQWAESMSLLLSSGVVLVKALSLSEEMINDFSFKSKLKNVRAGIYKGAMLNESIKKESLLDNKWTILIKVAEESNTLNSIFEQLTESLRADIEYKSKMLSSLLEPVIILFLGLVVGVILLSMYIPIFEMSTGV